MDIIKQLEKYPLCFEALKKWANTESVTPEWNPAWYWSEYEKRFHYAKGKFHQIANFLIENGQEGRIKFYAGELIAEDARDESFFNEDRIDSFVESCFREIEARLYQTLTIKT